MDPQLLQQAAQLLEAQFGTTIQGLQQQIQDLTHQLDQQRTQKPQTRPKPRLPDPEKFNGKKYHWDTWLPLIKAKIRLDRDTIGPEPDALFFYVYDNLENQIQALVLPQLRQAKASGQ